jgi:hypothetical protein
MASPAWPRRCVVIVAAVCLSIWGGATFVAAADRPPGRDLKSCGHLAPTIVGTAGDDLLLGTDHSDVISAGGGADIVYGYDGADVICGGAGHDELVGLKHDDRLIGGPGDDALFGVTESDRESGGPGDDLFTSGGADPGADLVRGGEGRDAILNTGPGDDVLDGGPGSDPSSRTETTIG